MRTLRVYREIIMMFLVFYLFPVMVQSRTLTFEDLLNCKRVSDVAISHDGMKVAFTVREYSTAEKRFLSDIYLTDLKDGSIRQLTTHSASDYHPVWSADDRSIFFISTRGGSPQVWELSLGGGEARQVTDFYPDVAGFILSPDGSKIAFHCEVYPECETQDCNREKDQEKPEINVKVYDRLMFRHWNCWEDGKRKHIFLYDLTRDVYKDLTPGDYDAPPAALGWGYDFSPDGNRLVFSSNHDPVIATSTNNDVWEVNLASGNLVRITTSRGNDTAPAYSPDGKFIAYLSMARPGFESDKFNLILYDRFANTFRSLTDTFRYSLSDFRWLPDSKRILVTAAVQGRKQIFLLNIENKSLELLIKEGYNSTPEVSAKGNRFVFLKSRFSSPAEVYLYDRTQGKEEQVTFLNRKLLSELEMNTFEEFWFKGAESTPVHGFLIRPPQFQKGKKYPLLLLIHGGPQGMWADGWHYRWNAQLFAAQGYVVVLINPRGSRGYGQKFTDEITRDWGGLVYEDLMKGVDYVLETYPFIDPERMGAAGASFGGYMIAWIEGHTNRFKCLVDHDGVYNLLSFYGTTEELWFPEWEFGGPPWKDMKNYLLFSPSSYVKNFQTPCLIIQGGQDFRVDPSEGIQFFTHLQRKGVPSRLVFFPDEGHWINNPDNSRFWYETVFEWLARYLNP